VEQSLSPTLAGIEGGLIRDVHIANRGRMTSNSETISIVFVVCRSLALDWNSKLSIRMVAGFAELIEGKRFFGCGGWI